MKQVTKLEQLCSGYPDEKRAPIIMGNVDFNKIGNVLAEIQFYAGRGIVIPQSVIQVLVETVYVMGYEYGKRQMPNFVCKEDGT